MRWKGEGRPPEQDGPIEPSKPREEVRQDPYPLPEEFVWSTLDIEDAFRYDSSISPTVTPLNCVGLQLRELYELSENYVEDDDASCRFQYTAALVVVRTPLPSACLTVDTVQGAHASRLSQGVACRRQSGLQQKAGGVHRCRSDAGTRSGTVSCIVICIGNTP